MRINIKEILFKIDLNSIAYDNHLTKENLLHEVTQEEIYSHYLGENTNDCNIMCSPFRNDSVPSFGLFYHNKEPNTLMFRDFATGDCGDCILFVSKLFSLPYYDAIKKIMYDMNLISGSDSSIERTNLINIEKIKNKEIVKIGIKKRDWELKDKNYWSSFGIKKSTLEKFNVRPISYVFCNDHPIKCEELAYAYEELKDGILSFKIYQPLVLNKRFKWINNANYTVHQGYTQLPESDDLLIITKSLKDVMAIHDITGIAAVGMQSESVMMKDSVMDEYKRRFKKVVCLFDNDPPGIKLSNSFADKYHIPYFLMPNIENVTDFSDLVKEVEKEEAEQIFYELINKII